MLASCQEKKFHIQKKIWPPPKKMLLDTVHPAKSNIPLYTICNLRFIIQIILRIASCSFFFPSFYSLSPTLLSMWFSALFSVTVVNRA